MPITPIPADTLAVPVRDLELPPRLRNKPISARGYPVPWFVAWFDALGNEVRPGTGTPDFRVVGHDRVERAWKGRRCWICGGPLGRFQVVVITPEEALHHVAGEPGGHADCARYAIRACPWLSNPRRSRATADMSKHVRPFNPAADPAAHSADVMVLWTTRTITAFAPDPQLPGVSFDLPDEPEAVSCWSRGRPATSDEIAAAVSEIATATADARQQLLDLLGRGA